MLKWADTPIARAERRYQRRMRRRKHSRWRTAIIPGVVLAGLILKLMRPVLSSHADWFALDLDSILNLWDVFIGATNIILTFLIPAQYFMAFGQGLIEASNSITRERLARTWETLILTGVDVRHLIYGKWAGTMRAVWLEWRPLLFSRAIGISWLMLSLVIGTSTNPATIGWWVQSACIVIVCVIVLPVCGIGLGCALGVCASITAKTPVGARLIVSGFQMLAMAILIAIVAVLFPLSRSSEWTGMVFPFAFGALDGGLTLLLTFMSPVFQTSPLIVLVLAVVFYSAGMVGLIGGFLMLAQRIARGQNVSVPPLRDSKAIFWTNNTRG